MRILIADADDFEARIYVRAFMTRSFDVDVVGDGEACLEEVRARPPDAILLDLMLPRRDGFGVLERLQTDASTANIPVVVVANTAQRADIERSCRFGHCPFFIKPFVSPNAIVGSVEALIRGAMPGAFSA